MKYLALILFSSIALAQDPTPAAGLCQSQLMRIQVDSNALNGVIRNTNELQRRVLPPLQTYLNSDAFKKGFITDYPLPSVGFPFNKEACDREKARDDAFKSIDCNDTSLCGNKNISETVKTRICFALPCAMVLGSKMDNCRPNVTARPDYLTFTSPVSLKQLDMTPESVALEGNTIRSCFKVSNMKVGLGVGIEFDDNAMKFDPIGLNNLGLELDGEREICLSATVDFSASPVLSHVNLENVTGTPFVSDSMIDKALRGSTISGLSGYTPETIEILKMTGLPPLARHFRPTVEGAITKVLAATFEKSVSGYLSGFSSPHPTRVDTPTNSMVSELGVGNIMVKKYVDLLDCSMMKREGKTIPADHSCFTSYFAGRVSDYYSLKTLPTVEKSLQFLKEAMGRNTNITSESLKQRLLNFGPRMKNLNLEASYNRDIIPVTEQITAAQSSSTLMSGIELVGRLSTDSQLSVGFCLPEICDKEKRSSHEGRNIPNCPIQTYVDTNELNNLLRAMYDSGRLCSRGRGEFVPQKSAQGEIVRDKSGMAQGDGCLFAAEEDADGLRCYLNGPPTLNFDKASNRYVVALSTRECFRGGVFVGLGKIGGDIDFNIGFTPTICNGGDFCLENGDAHWSVKPGTARFALRDSSWLNGVVKNRIDSNLKEMISRSLRIPLTSGQGPLANIPVVPEGRTDMGEGYFGACLKVK